MKIRIYKKLTILAVAVAAMLGVWADDSGVDVMPQTASMYSGYLYGKDTTEGTIQIKVGKTNKAGLAAVKAIVRLGKKKISLKAAEKGKVAVSSGGPTTVVLVGNGAEECTVELDKHGVFGTYGPYSIDGARNLLVSKDKNERKAVKEFLSHWIGPINVAWGGNTVSISLAKNGKAKVKGMLADGKTKISANSLFLAGELWCGVIVFAPKVNVVFNLWLSHDGRRVTTWGLGDGVVCGAPAPGANLVFKLGTGFEGIAGVQAALLPKTLAVKGGAKWDAGKAATVNLNAEKTAAVATKDPGNNSGLKLTYNAKAGSFKGSFNVYAVVGGKLKKFRANVTGVMIGAKGYGVAAIKSLAATAPITIE